MAQIASDHKMPTTQVECVSRPRIKKSTGSRWTHPGKVERGAGQRAEFAQRPHRVPADVLVLVGEHAGEGGQRLRSHQSDRLGGRFSDLRIVVVQRRDQGRQRLAREPAEPAQVLGGPDPVRRALAPQRTDECGQWIVGGGHA